MLKRILLIPLALLSIAAIINANARNLHAGIRFTPASIVAVPLEQVPSLPIEQVATIAIEHVPLPRERIAVVPLEPVAAIEPERVSFPRDRFDAILPQRVATIAIEHVPLPRERIAAVPPEPTMIPTDAMAHGQLRQIAALPAEQSTPRRQDHMIAAAPAATAMEPVRHHARMKHLRQGKPSLIERAASAAGGALKKLFEPTPTHSHRRRS